MKKKIITSSLAVVIATANTVSIEAMENTIQTELTKQNQIIGTVEDNQVTEDVKVEEAITEEVEETNQGTDSVVPDEGATHPTTEGGTTSPDTTTPEEQPPTVTPTEITVSSYAALKDAVAKDNVTINIDQEITFEPSEKLNVTGNNITINGGNNVFNLNETDTTVTNKFVIRGNNVTINDLTFNNYASVGIYAYKTTGLTIKNVKLNGKDDKSSLVGIDSDASTMTLESIHSKNHKYSGIRLRNNSSVNLLGGNSHDKDVKQLESNGDNVINQNVVEYAEAEVNGNKTYYTLMETIDVNNFQEFKDAFTRPNTIVNLKCNITLESNVTTKAKNVSIIGNRFKIDADNQFRLTVSAENTSIDGVIFENYKSGVLAASNATNMKISNVKFIGKDMSVSKDERSTFALDVNNNSTVSISNIESKNHLYRGIQVRNGATLEVLSKNTHTNDSVHIQIIQKSGEVEGTIIDNDGHYVAGGKVADASGTNTSDYYSKTVVAINGVEDFMNNITSSGNVLEVNGDIVFDKSNIPEGKEFLELIVNSNVVINGNGHTLDLGGVASIVLKGNNIQIDNMTIKNSIESGLNLYNSRNVLLEGTRFEHSTDYGLIVNGSTVTLKDVYTGNNIKGGILVTRSRTLRNEGNIDSIVTIENSITHVESNINVEVRNLEMLDGTFQNNQFIAPEGIYNKYVNDMESKKLSQYYLDIFGITGEAANKLYKEQSIDYMIIQDRLDVTNQTELKDENGNPIVLVGDGVFDNTNNLQKLIDYSALYGRELYFPAGIYKITGDINLDETTLPAMSNFTIAGDENGLAILDGSSCTDKMLKISSMGYHKSMNYINVNNMVFNNVGLEFNGVYKKGITLNNNLFMNGKYTKEFNSNGDLYKATMTPYITANNSKYIIKDNAFLRGTSYPGRGISTYATKNSTISGNFFGNLSGLNDASKMLSNKVIDKLNKVKTNYYAKSTGLNLEESQGNFFTCINNERRDNNVLIQNNYFNIEKTREISSDFGKDVLISGINVAKDGQRRDHIIYSKGYNGLNITGNYFKGMENGAAGGVKIRNGNDAYIGSNHFKDVPLLTYIYGDLTRAECTLHNTTIYNNLFHETTNFGGQGTGILYYQSFRNGDTLEFTSGGQVVDTWTDAYGDVQNFVMYKNQFFSDDKSEITISNRADKPLNEGQFIASENTYYGTDIAVNYDKGNFAINESTSDVALNKVNAGYNAHNTVAIPLMPPTTDFENLQGLTDKAEDFYEKISDFVGELKGEFSPESVNELRDLLDQASNLINNNGTQWEVNEIYTKIEESIEKVKDTFYEGKEDIPTILPDDVPVDTTDTPVTLPDDAPIEPDASIDPDGFKPVEDGTHMDDNTVNPSIDGSNGDNSNDSTLIPEGGVVQDGTHTDNNTVTPEVDGTNGDTQQNENPKTGDIGIGSYAALGLASLLGIFQSRRKRK